jgi:AraC-like DNA-binding protein
MHRQSVLAFLFAVCLAQAAFLAPVVASLKGVNRRATRVLALVIFCFLPMIGEELVSAAGLDTRFPHAIGTSTTVDFLLAPLLWFYARSLMDPDRPFVKRDAIHFIPFALATLVMLPFLTLSGPEKLIAVRDSLPRSFHVVIAAKLVVAPAYLTIIIRRLRQFVKQPDNPRARDPNVVWLLRAMIALAAMGIASVALVVLSSAGIRAPIDSDTLGILFIGASIYVISSLLIRHPLALVTNGGFTALIAAPPFRRKYETSPLGDTQKQEYLDRLTTYMTRDKPHLDMSLDLEKLAESVRMRPSHLSQILNERLGMNFYEFVNSYRVREAQSRIGDPSQADKTLIAIAHESGFNSKASFNRAFKRLTGQTPSEYARSHRQDASH